MSVSLSSIFRTLILLGLVSTIGHFWMLQARDGPRSTPSPRSLPKRLSYPDCQRVPPSVGPFSALPDKSKVVVTEENWSSYADGGNRPRRRRAIVALAASGSGGNGAAGSERSMTRSNRKPGLF